MKKKKMSLRKKVKFLNFLNTLMTIELLISMFAILFFINVQNNAKTFPTIELHKYHLKYEEYNDTTYLYTRGIYKNNFNKIDVAINSLNFSQVILHEYSHYIYNRLMTDEEKDRWENYICNKTLLNEQNLFFNYDEEDRCEEWFADRNSVFLLNHMYISSLNSTCSEMELFLNIIDNKYVNYEGAIMIFKILRMLPLWPIFLVFILILVVILIWFMWMID